MKPRLQAFRLHPSYFILVAFAVLLSSASFAQQSPIDFFQREAERDAPPDLAFDVPRLDAIAVDGVDDEWRAALHLGAFVDEDGSVLPQDDLAADVRVAWTTDGLALFIRVSDDRGVEFGDGPLILAADSVEVAVRPADEATGLLRVAFRPGGVGDLRPAVVLEAEPGEPRPGPVRVRANGRRDGGDWTAEVLLAPVGLTKRGLRPGDAFDLQMRINDLDGPKRILRTVAWNHDARGNGPWITRRIVLTDQVTDAFFARGRASLSLDGRYRAELLGAPALAGVHFFVRTGDGRAIGRGMFRARGGHAAAEVLLDRTDAAFALVEARGRPIGFVRLSDARLLEAPALFVLGTPDPDRPGGMLVTASLDPPGTERMGGESAARISIQSLDGAPVREVTVPLGEPQSVSVPRGSYLLYAGATIEGKDLDGWGLGFTDEPRARLEAILETVPPLVSDSRWELYRGWWQLNYQDAERILGTDVDTWIPATAPTAAILESRNAAREDPGYILRRGGRYEWGHYSEVDGSGQPMVIMAPGGGVDTTRRYPFAIFLHGYGEDQNAEWLPFADDEALRIFVLGRSRGSGYVAMGAVDVREAAEYFAAHWPVDPGRMQLVGRSMGAYGSLRIGGLDPARFAALRLFSAFAEDAPVENLRWVPAWFVHGIDDWSTPLTDVYAFLKRLNAADAEAGLRKVDGLGHLVWFNEPAWEESERWAAGRTRETNPSRIRQEVIDWQGRSAYWAQLERWGGTPAPAVLDLRWDGRGYVYALPENTGAFSIDTAAMGADPQTSLTLLVRNQVADTLAPPLPGHAIAAWSPGGWRWVDALPDEPRRIYAPGGPWAAYEEAPMAVVVGSTGTPAEDKALRRLADSVAISTQPKFVDLDNEYMVRDQAMLHGGLPRWQDTAVTDVEAAGHNVILLGGVGQNAVTRRWRDRLLMELAEDSVTAPDGTTWSLEGRAASIAVPNPADGQRMAWVLAAPDPAALQPTGTLITKLPWRNAPDFLLVEQATGAIVAARRFAPEWRWPEGDALSPFLLDAICTAGEWVRFRADAFRRAASADYALVWAYGDADAPFWTAGEAREVDALNMEYEGRLSAMTVSGLELAAIRDAIRPREPLDPVFLRLDPEPATTGIDAGRLYRVVLEPYTAPTLARDMRHNFPQVEPLGIRTQAALRAEFERARR